jgi:DNA-binding NtrC family response regulator
MFDVIETEKNLLLIDENPTTTALLTKLLKANYNCDEADFLDSALAKLRLKDYSVVLSNLNLPNVGGLDLISRIQTVAPLSVIILLGENVTADVIIRAFRAGVFDFLQTPLEFAQVETAVARAVEHYELKCLRDRYQFHLESLVADKTTEVDKALEEVETSYRITLKALVQALETRDFETHGHSERVVTLQFAAWI